MNTKTVQFEQGSVEFTEGQAERGIERAEPTELDMLTQALSDVTQRCAEMQEEMRMQQVLHEQAMEGMVAKKANDTGGLLFAAILTAITHMDNRRDEHAYRELKAMVDDHGEEFGHKEIDPMSAEALQGMSWPI